MDLNKKERSESYRSSIRFLTMGAGYSIALSATGQVFSWGQNYWGQLGDGIWRSEGHPNDGSFHQKNPKNITFKFPLLKDDKILFLSAGANHAGALSSLGRVFVWGLNIYNELGVKTGYPYFSSDPIEITNQFSLKEGDKIIALSMGEGFSSALSAKGRVFIWGRRPFFHWYEQNLMENSDKKKIMKPMDISNVFLLNKEERIVSILVAKRYSHDYSILREHAGYHLSALSSFGRVFTWGYNREGQLGIGARSHQKLPQDITARFSLKDKEKIVLISLGNQHSGALSSFGRVFLWGKNDLGQLGDNTRRIQRNCTEITNQFSLSEGDKIIKISLGGDLSSAISSKGRVFVWGYQYYQLQGDDRINANYDKPIEITRKFSLHEEDHILSIAIGSTHASALSLYGRVFTWGVNSSHWSGQLGDGTNIDRKIPTEITSLFLSNNLE